MPQLNDPKEGLLTGKLIESEGQGIIFLYLGISPSPLKRGKKKKGHISLNLNQESSIT